MDMRRREFIAFAGGATMWPLAASAQEAEGMAHVGVLGPGADNTLARIGYQAFSTELQKLGFTQGKNLQLDYLRTDQGMDLAVAAGRELVAETECPHESRPIRAYSQLTGKSPFALDCVVGLEGLELVTKRLLPRHE
jgi:hypothetical protein